MDIIEVEMVKNDNWKLYPIRIPGGETSKCCNKPTLLVQSMKGGFVTRNCFGCGSSDTLSNNSFLYELDLWISWPECRKRMVASIIESNYGFVCYTCKVGITLASMLPTWEELI